MYARNPSLGNTPWADVLMEKGTVPLRESGKLEDYGSDINALLNGVAERNRRQVDPVVLIDFADKGQSFTVMQRVPSNFVQR